MVDVLSRKKPQVGTIVTVPSIVTPGGAAVVGTALDYADGSHIHAAPVVQAYNAITNPEGDIFQVGSSGAAAADGSCWADSWQWFQSGTGAVQHNQYANNIADISINYKADILQLLVTTADASIGSTEFYMLRQSIEGRNARPLVNSMSLSFYMFAVKAGVYSVSLGTRSGSQIYVMEANAPANTWTYYKFENIPAMPAIQGDMRANIGLLFRLMLAGGSSFQTSLINAWNTGGAFVSTNQVNALDAINNAVYLYGVNLIPGAIALPYRPEDYTTRLNRVLRYRQVYGDQGTQSTIGIGQAGSTVVAYCYRPFHVPMLGVPALTVKTAASDFDVMNNTGGGIGVTSLALASIGTSNYGALLQAGVAAGLVAGNATHLYCQTANGRLVFESYPT